MDRLHPDGGGKAGGLVEAAQFSEAPRFAYNGVLALIVLLWASCLEHGGGAFV
jgi:hypothetical protein